MFQRKTTAFEIRSPRPWVQPCQSFAVWSWANKLLSYKFNFAIHELSGLDLMTFMKGITVVLLEQGSYSLWATSGLKPAFVSKVLLEHSHAQSLLSVVPHTTRTKLSNKYLMASEPKTLSGPSQKKITYPSFRTQIRWCHYSKSSFDFPYSLEFKNK